MKSYLKTGIRASFQSGNTFKLGKSAFIFLRPFTYTFKCLWWIIKIIKPKGKAEQNIMRSYPEGLEFISNTCGGNLRHLRNFRFVDFELQFRLLPTSFF